ncbi:RNA 2',3'-cyclic phosphodiesterase [Candidatus Peregrinibacteria bacterium]|nr:RNA 2',3'-cyclic phosphodiesterase [Candidatus Peregrinibacteria bacterium]
MHRIFIALPISDKLKKKVVKFQKQYSHLPVRWLDPNDVHITIVPPWEESDTKDLKKKFKALEGKLESVKNIKTLNLSYHIAKFGPDAKRPRLIWAEGKATAELPALKKELTKVFGLKEDKRPFKLHLTLARFSPHDFKEFPQKRIREKLEWKDKSNSIQLIESKLTKEGAKYKTLAEIEF